MVPGRRISKSDSKVQSRVKASMLMATTTGRMRLGGGGFQLGGAKKGEGDGLELEPLRLVGDLERGCIGCIAVMG